MSASDTTVGKVGKVPARVVAIVSDLEDPDSVDTRPGEFEGRVRRSGNKGTVIIQIRTLRHGGHRDDHDRDDDQERLAEWCKTA